MRGLEFYTPEGEKIPTTQVFNILYEGLNELIERNRKRLGTPLTRNADMKEALHTVETKNMIEKWIKQLENHLPIHAEHPYGETCEVIPARIHPTIKKQPDIFFLKATESTCPQNTLVVRRIHERDKKEYHPYTRKIEDGTFTIVPERKVIEANNILRRGGLPGITYEPIEQWSEKGQDYVLRGFYPSIKDTGASPESVALYLATMGKLGLITMIDDKKTEYCTGSPIIELIGKDPYPWRIINIDPDYWMGTNPEIWPYYGERKRIYDLVRDEIIPEQSYKKIMDLTKKHQKMLEREYGTTLERARKRITNKNECASLSA